MSAPIENLVLRVEADWIWLQKAPGIPVFPPHADPDGDCLLRYLVRVRPEQEQSWPDGFAGGIAHRLDVSSSGIVLAARSSEALGRAREAFAGGSLRKRYRLLSDGRVEWDENRVNLELAHHPRKRDRMVFRRGGSTPHRGRWYPAETRFQRLDGPLWEAVIRTGVMHQIRVHAAAVGIPLRGDSLYGGAPFMDAPVGVRFPLHHCRLEGLGGCPFSPPWF